MAGDSKGAVYAAIGGNSLVTLAKLGGFLVSGSAAMLSEAIHSFADVMNQTLLALGIRSSESPASKDHPLGYGRDRFVWALISAVGIFFLGCGVTIAHGVNALRHPGEHGGGDIRVLVGVLVFALIVEGWTLWVAWSAVKKARGERSLRDYLRETDDPMAPAVLLEDSAAVVGVLIALAAVWLAHVTGSHVWDAAGSILIGLLLGVVAVVLVSMNRRLLLTPSARPELVRKIEDVLAQDPVIGEMHSVRAVVVGAGAVRFTADVDFDGRAVATKCLEAMDVETLHRNLSGPDALRDLLIDFGGEVLDELGRSVDRVEQKAAAAVPELVAMNLEAD